MKVSLLSPSFVAVFRLISTLKQEETTTILTILILTICAIHVYFRNPWPAVLHLSHLSLKTLPKSL